MWNLDLALADVVSSSTDARLGAIRLAWWRERLEALDAGDVPGEPRLGAVARELLPRGIAGRELARLEDGWLPLLEPFPWDAPQADALRLRGRLLFGIAARLLGGSVDQAERAGELWSLADAAAHCSNDGSRRMLLDHAKHAISTLPQKVDRRLRPLTVLSALAACDASRGGVFGRGGAALKHRLTGRFPVS